MSCTVAVLNYGVGNVRSIMNALSAVECKAMLTDEADTIANCDKLLIPGVGAFAYCMGRLRETGLDDAIKRFAASGKPLLGICVGMQMLFESSEEHGNHTGLELLSGRVSRLPVNINQDVRLPHIGWNTVRSRQSAETRAVFSTPPVDNEYYFVHSYACVPKHSEHIMAQSSYGNVEFTAAVINDNICGVQFHPERSGKAGLAFLRAFVSELNS